MRPRPQWGQGWRKGDYHHNEKRFSTEHVERVPGYLRAVALKNV